MSDLSALSDADLMSMLQQPAPAPAPAPNPNVASMSDADLLAAINGPSVAADVAKSTGIGVAKGAIGLAGFPGDLRNLSMWGAEKLANAVGVDPETLAARKAIVDKVFSHIGPLSGPSSADIQKGIEGYTGDFYQPKTTLGHGAQTVAEFAPAALLGPGGIGRNLVTQAVIPGLASEASGQATAGTAAEPYARIVGGIAGGVGGAKLGNMISNSQLARTAPAAATIGNVQDVAGVKVPLTPGQVTGDVTSQRYVEAARKGNLGEAAKARVLEFDAKQQAAVDAAQGAIHQRLGGGSSLAATPYEAADVVQSGVQGQAAALKAQSQKLYDQFGQMEGNVDAGVFEGVGQKIRGDLSSARNPYIISEKTTPAAAQMLDHLDENLGRLNIQNRADPRGAPAGGPPRVEQLSPEAFARAVNSGVIGPAERPGFARIDRPQVTPRGNAKDTLLYHVDQGANLGYRAEDAAAYAAHAWALDHDANYAARVAGWNQARRNRLNDPGPFPEKPSAKHIAGAYEQLQNEAKQFGPVGGDQVKQAVSLQGLDRSRRELLSIARGAERGSEDARASQAIIRSFDERVQNAVSSHLYSGDPDAFETLKGARKLWATYAQTFKSQGPGDMAGKIVEKMIGRHDQPASLNDISNWLYGANGMGGSSAAVAVYKKLGGIFGQSSQEMQALRQGLFSRLTETAADKINMGPQKSSQRIFEFLNGQGRQLAETAFTTQERALINQYGQLQKKLIPAAGAINYSNTGHQLASMMKWTMNALATVGGLHVGGLPGAAAGFAANKLGNTLIDRAHLREVARHLDRPAGQMSTAPGDHYLRRGALLGGGLAANSLQR